MWENEKDLPVYFRQLLPQYSDINYYFNNVCQDIIKVAHEDYYGSSDIPIMAKKMVELKGNKILLFFYPVDQIAKAISNRKSYLKILKKGFKRSTDTKDIAQQIYEQIKADEGGCQGVDDYFDSF